MRKRTQRTPKSSANNSKLDAESGTPHKCDAKVELDHWNREFDALHARMQSDEARRAVDALFSASDAELNRSKS